LHKLRCGNKNIMKNTRLETNPVAAVQGRAGKAPYVKPVLRVFGSVKSLTKGNGGSITDGYSPGARPVK
jgi:hypothetical protein